MRREKNKPSFSGDSYNTPIRWRTELLYRRASIVRTSPEPERLTVVFCIRYAVPNLIERKSPSSTKQFVRADSH